MAPFPSGLFCCYGSWERNLFRLCSLEFTVGLGAPIPALLWATLVLPLPYGGYTRVNDFMANVHLEYSELGDFAVVFVDPIFWAQAVLFVASPAAMCLEPCPLRFRP